MYITSRKKARQEIKMGVSETKIMCFFLRRLGLDVDVERRRKGRRASSECDFSFTADSSVLVFFFRDKMEKRPAKGGGLKILQGKIDKASERLFPSVRTAEFRVSSCI